MKTNTPIPSKPPVKLLAMTQEFFKLEAASGILLIIAAVLALIVANSPWSDVYVTILNKIYFTLGFSSADFGDFLIKKPLLLWINDGFMAIFFFLVGLEIKREIMRGELSSRERALLPLLAALGGTILPALIYVGINWHHHPENLRGWAIPTATDIAFALGVLALIGSRAPVSLKILLTAIAIIDDLGAILIIALFYTSTIHFSALYVAVMALMGMIILNTKGVMRIAPYILLGFILWAAMLKSGVHATIAGVITAFCIPLTCKNNIQKPLERLEHALHPWVAFAIVPIFAFANAGVSFAGMTFGHLFAPVTLGIICALVIGKTLGAFSMMAITIKTGLCQKPEGASWRHLFGVAALCGIGFTMSLFIGELSFEDNLRQAEIRLGVLVGSCLSTALAFFILRGGDKRG